MAWYNFTKTVIESPKEELGNYSTQGSVYTDPLNLRIEKNQGESTYNFGRLNNYPKLLIELYDTSPTHQAIINRTSLMIAGDGASIEKKSDDLMDMVQATMLIEFTNDKENLSQVNAKIGRDMKLHGRYAIECIWNEAHDKIVEIKHVDVAGIRVGILDENNEIPFYKYSDDWNNRTCEIITYQPLGRNNEGFRQLLYVQFMRSGHLYYGLPDYYASIDWIELESQIGISHSESAKNGFSPKVAVVFPAKPESEEIEDKIMDNLNATYSGSRGKKILGIFSPRPELKPEIIPLNVENLHNQYIVIDDQTQNKILTGHGVVSPMLFGIKTANGLSSNADELMLSYSIYEKTVVKPYQMSLQNSLNLILRESGNRNKIILKPYTLGIMPSIKETLD
tara:strand:+ start:3636 stop:4817 length:1182 start_codon:yes stop_codon:yes gene_type:complete